MSVTVRLDAALMLALDRCIEEDMPRASRAEVLRTAFRDWALDKGLLAPLTD
jgi:metal-responsive CopG/Arc/MetJ family transcriptional regulator